MIEDLLLQNEGKSLEFKENTNSPAKIIRTVIALANTAGGVIVIGVVDESKEVVGVANILKEEERIANLIYELVAPQLLPDIEIVSYEGKELLLINVPHMAGVFHLKKAGIPKGVYIRLGSSNRLADPDTLANLQRLAKRMSFDEMPCMGADISALNQDLIAAQLGGKFKNFSDKNYESLGLITSNGKKKCATHGGLLLFGIDKTQWMPDAIVKCVAFASVDRKHIVDKRNISTNLIDSVSEVIAFIQRNTRVAAEIGAVKRTDIHEYPVSAVREAVVNSILHADYSIKGASVQIAIYSDRLEITNPGGLPFGQTIDSALSGISKLRNPIIGRIFREIGIVETLGTGMLNILHAYEGSGDLSPVIEEIDHFFKVTLYSRHLGKLEGAPWLDLLYEFLAVNKTVSTSEIAKVWGVTDRTARARLNKLLLAGKIKRHAKSANDPSATYSI